MNASRDYFIQNRTLKRACLESSMFVIVKNSDEK